MLASCCLAAMLTERITTGSIAGLLISVIISSISIYSDKRAVKTALIAVYAFFCFLRPEFLWAAPLTGYELCYQREENWLCVFLLPLFLNRRYAGIIVLLFFLGWVLARKTQMLEKKEREFRKMQDTYSELKTRTEYRQSELIKQQDGEIHLATLAERNRIAREIHDNVGHMLSRSILQVGALKAVNRQESLAPQLDALQETLNTAMNSIRESVHDLKDEAFDLEEAICKMIPEYPDFHIQLDYDMSSQAPRNLKYCFAAIIQEALTNTVKHSNATKIRIVVREHPALYQLLIEDNGTKQEKQDIMGMGLENMKERADSFGGTFHVSRENGFRIFLSVPKMRRV